MIDDGSAPAVPASRRAAVRIAMAVVVLAGSGVLGYHLRGTVGSLPRLGAGSAQAGSTSAGCPTSHIATGRDVSDTFAVDYPCGWHVFVYSEEDLDREDVVKAVVAFDRFPFNLDLLPMEGPIGADIEMWDYFALPGDERDTLTDPIDEWVDLVRKRVGKVEGQEVVRAADGTKMIHVVGENALHVGAEGYVIEYSADQGGRRRHVVVIFAQTSDAAVRDALAHVAGSFRLPRGTSA